MHHEGKKLQTTQQGEVLYQQAAEIFRAIRETQSKVSEAQGDVSGVVHFTTTSSVALVT
jgi:DNA-binding transcriptional LysR family regulator